MSAHSPKAPSPGKTATSNISASTTSPRQTSSGVDEHQGATEDMVGDRTGPAAGYDDEPVKAGKRGGVAGS